MHDLPDHPRPGRFLTSRQHVYFGNAFHPVRATHGGFLELMVDVRSRVAAGQTVAVQRNSFVEVVKGYKSEVSSEVTNLQRDAMIEPGTRVVQVLYDSNDPECAGDGCGEESPDYAE